MERPALQDRMAHRRSALDFSQGSGLAGLHSMRRVLVTGATGCVGRHVLPELIRRGWEVHAVSSRDVRSDAENVAWHRADLLVPGQTKAVVDRAGASHLLHLAWNIVPTRWATAIENFLWVQAGLELVRAFSERGGARLVTAGSCLEYDWSYGYCSESRTPCNPHSAYGVCKHALQMLSSAYAAARGMSSAWARIFFLYGPL